MGSMPQKGRKGREGELLLGAGERVDKGVVWESFPGGGLRRRDRRRRRAGLCLSFFPSKSKADFTRQLLILSHAYGSLE